MRLTLPLPANVANARMHWAVKLRSKKAFYKACDQRQNVGLIPPPPEQSYPKARVSTHWYVHNLMDEADNLPARAKFVLDWLVTRGYLADDNRDVVEWVKPVQEIDRKNKRVVVTVDPIP